MRDVATKRGYRGRSRPRGTLKRRHSVTMDGLITLRRIVISLILAACLVGLGYGLSLSRPTNKPIIYKDSAIKVLTPEPGDLALSQATIGVTLAPAYTLADTNSPGFAISTGNGTVGIPQ